jgi:hypothetical protein
MSVTLPVSPTIPFTCTAPGVWAVTSSQPGRAPYVVRCAGTHWTCDCPAYTYSKADPASCKHVDAVRAIVSPAPARPLCMTCGEAPMLADDLRCRRCADAAAAAAKVRRPRVKVRHDSVARVIDTTPLVVEETAVRERLDWEYAERQRLEALNQRVAETVFGR